MFNWLKRFWYGKVQDSIVAEESRTESRGRIERRGSTQRGSRGIESKTPSKVGRQSEKGKLSSKDGQRKGSRKGRKGETNTVTSKSKSVGSKQQSGRKIKSKSNKQKKQS